MSKNSEYERMLEAELKAAEMILNVLNDEPPKEEGYFLQGKDGYKAYVKSWADAWDRSVKRAMNGKSTRIIGTDGTKLEVRPCLED